MVKLSILDQSPIISGQTPAAAIHATLELAQAADRMGYHRYWLAEHHAMTGLADPCPEILLGQIGARTQRIRIGTGGVLLPYYSPLKVAEVFRMYEALFPGRVDLGIGRAPGGNLLTAKAMNAEAFLGDDRFPTQVQELVGYLDDTLPPEYPYHMVKAMPSGPTSPEVWLLGSSDYSGALASYLGLRFAFAHFINAQGGDAVMRAYREQFRASYREHRPCAMLAVFVICAPTQEQAEALAASIDLRRYQMSQGIEAPVATMEEARAYVYSEQAKAIVQRERARAVIGTPESVRARLLALRGTVRRGRADGDHDHGRLCNPAALLRTAGRGLRLEPRGRLGRTSAAAKKPGTAHERAGMTQMRTLSLLVCLAIAVLAGCAGPGKDSGPAMITSANLDRLVNREWLLKNITVDSQRVIMHVDATQTVQFGSDGRVIGYGGVNRFAGTYKFSPEGVLSFPAPGLVTTRMAGPPEIMEKERAYLKGLAKVTRAIVAQNGLQMQSEDGATVLVFEQIGK